MHDIIKNVIMAKKFDLSDLLKKIDTIWIQGGITADEKAELAELARQNADTRSSYDLAAKLEELDRRVALLEGRGGAAPDAYPPYTAGKWYYSGDRVSYAGFYYVCVAPEGAVCVWSPAEYPQYWQLCEPSEVAT